jgi:hypothetical protein
MDSLFKPFLTNSYKIKLLIVFIFKIKSVLPRELVYEFKHTPPPIQYQECSIPQLFKSGMKSP